MRDFAKSVFSFSWASMVFGARQLLNPLQSRSPNVPGGGSSSAPRSSPDFFDRTFRAGDTLQRGMVDMMFGAFTANAANPMWWLRQSTDTLQRSFGAFQQTPQAAGSGPSPSAGSSTQKCASTGWGPVS